MSETTVKRSSGNVGTPFYLFVLLLALLLGVVTAYAVKYNPLYSDRDTYGVSKYMFIEHCKEKLQDTGKLKSTVVVNNQPVAEETLSKLVQEYKLVKTGETLGVATTAAPTEIVRQVQPITTRQGEPARTGLQWQSPVEVYGTQNGNRRVLFPAFMQCEFDKAKGDTVTTLFISQ